MGGKATRGCRARHPPVFGAPQNADTHILGRFQEKHGFSARSGRVPLSKTTLCPPRPVEGGSNRPSVRQMRTFRLAPPPLSTGPQAGRPAKQKKRAAFFFFLDATRRRGAGHGRPVLSTALEHSSPSAVATVESWKGGKALPRPPGPILMPVRAAVVGRALALARPAPRPHFSPFASTDYRSLTRPRSALTRVCASRLRAF